MSTTYSAAEVAALLKSLGIEAPAPAKASTRKSAAKKAASKRFYTEVIAARQTCPRCARTFTPKSSGFAAGKHSRKVGSKWVPCA